MDGQGVRRKACFDRLLSAVCCPERDDTSVAHHTTVTIPSLPQSGGDVAWAWSNWLYLKQSAVNVYFVKLCRLGE